MAKYWGWPSLLVLLQQMSPWYSNFVKRKDVEALYQWILKNSEQLRYQDYYKNALEP